MKPSADMPAAAPVPHSWPVSGWPASVYPNSPARGRYLIGKHRHELTIAGALVRVGRELVVIGPEFERWLAAQAAIVASFEFAARLRSQTADQHPFAARAKTTTP